MHAMSDNYWQVPRDSVEPNRETITVCKGLTTAELRDLRRRRDWLFEASYGLPDGKLRYEFSRLDGKPSR
jgi:hypothetical protein